MTGNKRGFLKYIWLEEKGQSAIEAAIVLPLFLFIIMGMMTYGMWIYAKMVVVLSASQGARVGGMAYGQAARGEITEAEANTKINQTALTFLTNGLNGNERTVEIIPNPQSSPRDITVRVRYTFRNQLPLLGDLFTQDIPISYTSTYVVE